MLPLICEVNSTKFTLEFDGGPYRLADNPTLAVWRKAGPRQWTTSPGYSDVISTAMSGGPHAQHSGA